MNEPPITLSVVIPAYNESARLQPTLERVHAFLDQQPYTSEILVIDDGSSDATHEVATKFSHHHARVRVLKNETNAGKGASVKRGMLEATGLFRLFSDADLSTPIEEITPFLRVLQGLDQKKNRFDVVIGSRRVAGARLLKRQPAHREASGRVFSLLVRLFTLRGFLDTQCGFKLFTARAAKEIFQRMSIQRFGFDVEILYIAKKVLGYEILEAPVQWIDSPASQVRLGRDASKMFLDLFQIRLNAALGRYRLPPTS